MKKMMVLMLAAMTLLAAAAPALALGPVDLDAELGVFSKYVWRGMIVTNDPVIQPALAANFLGIGLGFWGNIDSSDVNGTEWKFNEIDWDLSYSLPLPIVDLDFGFIYYTFPNTEVKDTVEGFISAKANVLLSPRLSFYGDFKEIDGTYWSLGITHGIEISPTLNLDLSADLGIGSANYVKGYFGTESDSATDYALTAELPWKPVPLLTITPSAAYTSLLGDAKEAVDVMTDIDTNTPVFGLTAAVNF